MPEQTTTNRSLPKALGRCPCATVLWTAQACAALACLAAPALLAQAYTPPPPPLTTAPCVPTKKEPCPDPPPPPPAAKDDFPFPGDATPAKPVDPDDKFPFPGESPGTTSGASSAKPAASDGRFPFPGEPSSSSSGSSNSSSSSSGSSSSSPADGTPAGPPLRDEGSSGSTPSSRRKLAKVEDVSEREAKDLEVSHFYLVTGNYLGAYNRAKDAIRLFPDDAEAHFDLAAAAQKLKKTDEATAEYRSYLKLEPDGDHVKDAQRALGQIR